MALRFLASGIPAESIHKIFEDLNDEFDLWRESPPTSRYFQLLRNCSKHILDPMKKFYCFTLLTRARNALPSLNDEAIRAFIKESDSLLLYSDATPNKAGEKIYCFGFQNNEAKHIVVEIWRDERCPTRDLTKGQAIALSIIQKLKNLLQDDYPETARKILGCLSGK